MKAQNRILLVAGLAESLVNFRGDLIQDLLKCGIEVHCAAPDLHTDDKVLAWLRERRCVCHDIPLQRSGLNPWADIRTFWILLRLVRRYRFKIVLAYTIKPVVYGGFAAWVGRVPVRAAMITGLGFAFAGQAGRCCWAQFLARRLYCLGTLCATRVFFQNDDDRDLFLAKGWVQAGKVTMLAGSGVNTGSFAYQPLPAESPPRFLMIARLLWDKGVREYIEAAEIVKQRYPEALFSLAGWKDDSPAAVSEEEISAWQDSGTINFLGRLEDVRPELNACSVFVLPSYREGTPRTVLEAMAVGRPVITTDTPGCRGTVIDGESGFLVPVRSATALADRMIWCIEHPGALPEMGAKARLRAENQFHVAKVNSIMLKALGVEDFSAAGTEKPALCVVASSPMTIRVFLFNHLAMLSRHYRVSVAADFREDELDLPAGVKRERVPVYRRINLLGDLKALWILWRYFSRNRFKVVHSVTPKAGLLSALAGVAAGVPVRLHWFTGQVWVTRRGASRYMLKLLDVVTARLCTRVLVDSHSQHRFLVEQKVLPPGKGMVLGHGSISGVDGQRFQPDAGLRVKTRKEMGFMPDDVVILCLGRINRDKGVLDLAHAFSKLAARYPQVRLLLAGPDEENLVPAVRRICSDCLDRVTIIGYVEQPQVLMNASDVFCQPSYREGFGSVVIEAAACGIPAAVSRIYGLADSVVEGVTGVFFEPANVSELEQALSGLCGERELRLKMGRAARERALRDFSMTDISRRLLEFYFKEAPVPGGVEGGGDGKQAGQAAV